MKKRITVLLALVLTMIMSVSALAAGIYIQVYTGNKTLTKGDTIEYFSDIESKPIDFDTPLGEQNISDDEKDGKVLAGWNVWNTSSGQVGLTITDPVEFYSVNDCYNDEFYYSKIFEPIYEEAEPEKTVGRSYSLERINTIKDLSIIHTDGVVRDSQMKTAVDFVNKYSHPTITVISSGDSITLPAGMTKDMDDNTDIDLILMNRWGGIVIPDEMLELVGDKELTITITENEIVITADGEPLVFEDGIKMTIPYTRRSTTGNVAVSVTVGEETAVQENGYDQSTDTISFTINGSCGFARINDYSADGTGSKSNVYVSSPNR